MSTDAENTPADGTKSSSKVEKIPKRKSKPTFSRFLKASCHGTDIRDPNHKVLCIFELKSQLYCSEVAECDDIRHAITDLISAMEKRTSVDGDETVTVYMVTCCVGCITELSDYLNDKRNKIKVNVKSAGMDREFTRISCKQGGRSHQEGDWCKDQGGRGDEDKDRQLSEVIRNSRHINVSAFARDDWEDLAQLINGDVVLFNSGGGYKLDVVDILRQYQQHTRSREEEDQYLAIDYKMLLENYTDAEEAQRELKKLKLKRMTDQLKSFAEDLRIDSEKEEATTTEAKKLQTSIDDAITAAEDLKRSLEPKVIKEE